MPSGRWNLRLTSAPFAPHYLWDQALARGKALSLGKVELKRGGSVVGRVTTVEGPVNPERAGVSLRPLVEEEPVDPRRREELRQLALDAEVRPEGWFYFSGVRPGSYQIVASHPGFVIGRSEPVAVEAGRSAELDEPLVLELPLRAMVQVEPATDPTGGAWSLWLDRMGDPLWKGVGAHGETDPTGFWEADPLPPGQYALRVVDGEENTHLWHDLELRRGGELVQVELPLVYVEGTVTLGSRPLAATLWFGGRTGAERIEAESDDAGEFFAVLPREGEWRVDVRAEDPPVRSRGLRARVEPTGETRQAEIRIEVPDTLVSGKVVDAAGEPPSGSPHVNLRNLSEDVGVTYMETDRRGGFEIRGVPPGRYVANAETAEARSENAVFQVSEGSELSITLVLRSDSSLAGRVFSDSGPVPGATVHASGIFGTGQGALGKVERARSGPDGRFEVQVPAEATEVRLWVTAPGYAMRVMRVPPDNSASAEVRLDRAAGVLHLEGVGDAMTIYDGSEVALVLLDGEPFGLMLLREWARNHGSPLTEDGDLRVPWMPSASYALCRLAIHEAVLVVDSAALPSEQACSEGYLAPGGELILSLPGG